MNRREGRLNPKIQIPVVDLFAGPGGLGEGFSRLQTRSGRAFKTAISIEMDPFAHATLKLRSFYRQFERPPAAYIERLRGEIDDAALYQAHPAQAAVADDEAWHAELGSAKTPVKAVRERVGRALRNSDEWVLLGGPPCQAYSLAGRSRNKGRKDYRFETDVKTTLYLEYLQLIADFWPAVFVMENVKGLLSAKTSGNSMFDRIREDLSDPAKAIRREGRTLDDPERRHTYDLYSIVARDEGAGTTLFGGEQPADFVVRAEQFGIPQARHRLILIGIRRGFTNKTPRPLKPFGRTIPICEVIGDLPALRSGLSEQGGDNAVRWAEAIESLARPTWRARISSRCGDDVAEAVRRVAERAGSIASSRARGAEYLAGRPELEYRRKWYETDTLPGVVNHVARTHMKSDIQRYAFAACFAQARGRAAALVDFPKEDLLPDHLNVLGGIDNQSHFVDRFRVQMNDRPSTTITSHISKDGHYYIHPDPMQCRSLTMREAA